MHNQPNSLTQGSSNTTEGNATGGGGGSPKEGNCVVVMTENAEEVQIANMGVAFEH